MEILPLNKPDNHSFPTLIRCKKVCEKTGLSRSYVYQLSRAGKFPKPIALVPGGSSVAWIEHEVEEFITNQINSSRGIQ